MAFVSACAIVVNAAAFADEIQLDKSQEEKTVRPVRGDEPQHTTPKSSSPCHRVSMPTCDDSTRQGLSDVSPDVRARAIETLDKCGYRLSIDEVRQLLNDESFDVVHRAVASIHCDDLLSGPLRSEALALLERKPGIGPFDDALWRVAHHLAHRCEIAEACPILARQLEDVRSLPTEDSQVVLFKSIGYCKWDSMRKALSEFLRETQSSEDASMLIVSTVVAPREAAVEALVELGSSDLPEVLGEAMQDRDIRVREAALRGVCRSGLEIALRKSVGRLARGDPNPFLREKAQEVLSRGCGSLE